MKQDKLESLIESSLNTASGLVIALTLTTFFNMVDNPILYLGDGMTALEVILWTGLMTVVSVTRSYSWRRFFNASLNVAVHKFVSKLFNKGQL